MKITGSITAGAWLLISINLAMAFGSIWIFQRMAPAIEVIIDRNENSLASCEDMLVALLGASGPGGQSLQSQQNGFQQALAEARNNITEPAEPDALQKISDSYAAAFAGDASALRRTVLAISELGDINRHAMRRADLRAKQLGSAGAWSVVFMAGVAFMCGMIFLRSLRKNIADPMEEIDEVMTSFRGGDRIRRCSLVSPGREVRRIFKNVNAVLDMQGNSHQRNAFVQDEDSICNSSDSLEKSGRQP